MHEKTAESRIGFLPCTGAVLQTLRYFLQRGADTTESICDNFVISTFPLKGLSHKIERGCRWYGSSDLYVEKCHKKFIIFSSYLSIFYSNKSPLSMVEKC